MFYLEIAAVLAAAWILVILLNYLQSRGRGPAGLRAVAERVFQSFWPSLVIHLGLFIVSYGFISYLFISATSEMVILPVSLSFLAGGFFAAIELIRGIRIGTDKLYLLRKWITEDIQESHSIRQYMEPMLEKISADSESEFSRNALVILRELAMRGDARGAEIQRELKQRELI